MNAQHSLPATEDEDIDQPLKNTCYPAKSGCFVCLNDDASNTRYRNLPFNAGTAATYGLSKEEALSAITFNAAKLLGIDDKTGSIEAGKDANIIISNGDVLDMKTSVVSTCFYTGKTDEVSITSRLSSMNVMYAEVRIEAVAM